MACTSTRVLLRSNPTCNMRTGPPSIALAGSHTASVIRGEAPVFMAFSACTHYIALHVCVCACTTYMHHSLAHACITHSFTHHLFTHHSFMHHSLMHMHMHMHTCMMRIAY